MNRSPTRRLRALLTPLLLAAGAAIALSACAPMHPTSGPLVLESQGSFFVGGHDVKSDTLSTLPAYEPKGTITVDQMYVRYQTPPGGARHYPLTLIHGCCLTGKTWETTPDGRMGWDEYFVRQGYPVYVIDQAARGRSAANPSVIESVKLGKTPPDQLPPLFSAGHESAWAIFRFGKTYPEVLPGMRFPLEAEKEFWKQMVPDWSAALPTPNPTVPALSELAIRLGGTVLVSHSQSGIYPFQTAALNTQGVAGIVAVEPAACPSPTGDLKPYLKMPVMVMFGDYVDLFPRWAPRLKLCREFTEAVNRAGGRAQLIVLPEIGIKGNSHMLMQDRNNLELADIVLDWVRKNVGPRP